jgi:hypothetical protein
LRCALGKYFDDVGDFAQAFSNYQRANELAKLYRPIYDRLDMQRRIGQIIRLYDREWMSRAHPNMNPASRPVFIVGLQRTGTTLAEQILASHPAVFSAGAKDYWTIAAIEHEACMANGDDSEILIGKLACGYLRLLEEFSSDALRVVDKMTTNFICLGLIHAALPNARIIHMRRNPIDACLSNYFDVFTIANDLEDLAHFGTEYSRLMEHWRLILPKVCILDVPYEALVDEQEAWSRRMLEFTGLTWDARCIDFHQTKRPVITASRWQVRQEMGRGSVERWRNHARFIEPLLRSMQVRAPEGACKVSIDQEGPPRHAACLSRWVSVGSCRDRIRSGEPRDHPLMRSCDDGSLAREPVSGSAAVTKCGCREVFPCRDDSVAVPNEY